jgi:hypothetical protein
MGLQLCSGYRVRGFPAEYNYDRGHNQQRPVDTCTGGIGVCPGFTSAAVLAWSGRQITQGTLGVALCRRPRLGWLWDFREHVSTTTAAVKHVQRHRHCVWYIGAYSYTNVCAHSDAITPGRYCGGEIVIANRLRRSHQGYKAPNFIAQCLSGFENPLPRTKVRGYTKLTPISRELRHRPAKRRPMRQRQLLAGVLFNGPITVYTTPLTP